MKKLLSCVVPITLSALALTACSGSGSSSSTPFNPDQEPAKIQGVLHAKTVSNVDIYTVPIDAQGQPMQNERGEIMGETTKTNTAGEYNSQFSHEYVNKPGIVLAYPNGIEATENLRYSTAVGKVLFDQLGKGSKMRINLNWITSLASDFAYSSYIDENGTEGANPNRHMPGIYTVYTIERANLWLSKQFDISDIVSVTPILPTQLNNFSALSSQERTEGIRYGALVAAGLSLAGNDEKTWFEKVRNQQREFQGQLYKNASSNEFSLCELYTEAHSLLSAKLGSAPAEAQTELSKLKSKKTEHCSKSLYTKTEVEVPFEEIEAWTNAAERAKEFLIDLNQRLSNLTGKTPINGNPTCAEWNIAFNKNEHCTASFFDPNYVSETENFHGELQRFYKENEKSFKDAQELILTSVLEFTACLNKSACSTTNYTEATDKDKAEYKIGDLVFTYEPDESVKSGDKYHAFNFYITGSQTVADSTITYSAREIKEEGKDTITLRPRLRVVYEQVYKEPPHTVIAQQNNKTIIDENFPADAVEPLGFDYEFPKLKITDFAGNKLETYMAFKLIGVKPHHFEKSASDYPYHYNYTQLVIQNDIDVANNSDSKVKINIVIKTANGANFYAKNVWPNLEDLFKNEGGDSYYDDKKAGADISDPEYDKLENLFSYSLMEGKKIVLGYACADGKPFDEDTFKCSNKEEPEPQYTKADYFEITPQGLPTNRYELYAGEQAGTKYKTLRNCAIPADGSDEEKESKKICGKSEEVFHDFQLFTNEEDTQNTLFEKNKDGSYKYFSLFAILGYGAYEPQFPKPLSWGDNQQMGGKRTVTYSQGLEDFSILVDQKFKNKKPAIAKINFSKNTPTSWEVAASLGYDYDEDARDALEQWGLFMEQGLVASGDYAQSLYFSYFVNDEVKQDEDGSNERTDYTELSSLVIFRGGVTFIGAGKAEAAGVVIAGNNKYTIKDGGNKGCGYLFKDFYRKLYNDIDDSCVGNKVAYLTFRQALLAVVREEQEGKFIARFSDGSAVKLDFMQSLPKFFLDDLNKKD